MHIFERSVYWPTRNGKKSAKSLPMLCQVQTGQSVNIISLGLTRSMTAADHNENQELHLLLFSFQMSNNDKYIHTLLANPIKKWKWKWKKKINCSKTRAPIGNLGPLTRDSLTTSMDNFPGQCAITFVSQFTNRYSLRDLAFPGDQQEEQPCNRLLSSLVSTLPFLSALISQTRPLVYNFIPFHSLSQTHNP